MHFLAVGDSITFGEGATRHCLSYPCVLTQMLRHTRGIQSASGLVVAEPGWTSGALNAAAHALGRTAFAKERAIIIWVGGDDLGYAALAAANGSSQPMRGVTSALKRYGYQLRGLVRYIQTSTHTPIYLCTQYNPFPNSPLAVDGIAALNAVTKEVADSAGCICVPTASWFAGRQKELIAGYHTGTLRDIKRHGVLPIHPNNAGHQVIARGLYGIIAPKFSL
ncbi:SGNH/GDSL hydrolase family protein [Alicyclobacillus suci]|uniref:SGNH/GDSL hydrolase family protein n=1 Tax=Alicyclobacillus suci TaxID=2816080 RepID=UPI001A8FD131|nr:SGNH/GDSL hydrolase family protein [Alicyclobacillus suci]